MIAQHVRGIWTVLKAILFFFEQMIVSCNLQVKHIFILEVLFLFMNKIFVHWNG